MDNVTPIDPSLLAEWSRAIVNVDLERVQQLYTDDLLWQPLDKNIARIDTDHAHLNAQLERFRLLGPALGDLAAFPYALLDHLETSDAQAMPPSMAQQKRRRLLSFLLRKSRPDDLNSWSWGPCHNKTLHLAAFLGQKQIVDQLVERGASMASRNDFGYTPASVVQEQQEDEDKKVFSTGPLQSPTRFQELRAKVESTDDLKKNPQHQHRKQDIALLAQRSAVKNNPLFKKFEQQQQQQQKPRGGPSQKNLLTPEANEDRRGSKMISSLKTKSYVSSSIFRQGEAERPPMPSSSSRSPSPLAEQEEAEKENNEAIPNFITPSATEEQQQKDTLPSTPSQNDNYANVVSVPNVVLDTLERQKETLPADVQQQQQQRLEQEQGDESHRWSDSQLSHGSISGNMQHRQSSHSESEQWYDSYDQQQLQQEHQDDVPSPLRQSMTLEAKINNNDIDSILTDDDEAEGDSTPTQSVINQQQAFDQDTASVESTDPSVSFSPKQRMSTGAESVDTWPPPSSPYSTRSIEGDGYHYNNNDGMAPNVPSIPDVIKEKMVGVVPDLTSPSAPTAAAAMTTTTTMTTAPAPAPATVAGQTQQYGNISHRTTEHYVSHHISSCAEKEEDDQEYQAFIDHDPPAMALELAPVDHHPSQTSSAFGKLYVRVTSAENLLLPLPPKLTTFVRCVVTDGDQHEYTSRYEVLGEKVVFDYECILDARPDMIIAVALHVRPDPHVQRKTGLSRLFTSARKQRESLPAYMDPVDGAVGQTRFALGHMVQACNQKTYAANLDCFNSWFLRSSRERHLEMLKVVGRLNIEMLYLPVLDPTRSVPKTMRECDLSLRIRQWHNTCWHSGYLSFRLPGSKFWDRHYCRLIGSQLMGYASKAASEWKPLQQFEIADTVRLVASSDQVIVTLVDVPDQRVFQPDSIIEETSRGYFRVIFVGSHVDCVSDKAEESEEWVKVLKSMIGRVPLKLPSSEA